MISQKVTGMNTKSAKTIMLMCKLDDVFASLCRTCQTIDCVTGLGGIAGTGADDPSGWHSRAPPQAIDRSVTQAPLTDQSA